MKLITLNKKGLESNCKELASVVSKHKSFDLVIGIKTGGAVVGNIVYTELKNNHNNLKYTEVSLSRKSKGFKEKTLIKSILKILPYFILNLMRRFESVLSTLLKRRISMETLDGDKNLKMKKLDQLLSGKPRDILIIDDAVDSGKTLFVIDQYIKSINSKIKIEYAVITITQKSPLILPDYYLYKNTLIRFPWSYDYKGKDKIQT
ncbi:MAG: hypothetical protein KAS64_04225 [Spirochaetes bacterium]|nr:hypothetical protein [Spirochaetota bacterium]